MNESKSRCSRCNEATGGDAFGIDLKRAIADTVPKELKLCQRCVKSFEFWYLKRAKPSFNLDPPRQSKLSGVLPTAFQSADSKRIRKQIQRHIVVGSVTVVIFVVAFYWTWTILKKATRIDE